MSRSFFASWVAPGAVVALVSGVCLSLCPAAGWAQTTESQGASAPRTPWGAPDIGGLWNSSTVTPLERPAGQADKEFLTEEEAAAIERQVVDRNNRANAPSVVRTEPLPVGGNVGAYNNFWLDRGTTVVPTRRTSLVVDPPNGRLPSLTPDAQRRRTSAERQRLTAVREGRVPADSYDQFDLGDRCIWYRGIPSTRGATGRAIRSWSKQPILAIRPSSSRRAVDRRVGPTGISPRPCVWWNASRA